jgi:hypothetical protein
VMRRIVLFQLSPELRPPELCNGFNELNVFKSRLEFFHVSFVYI